MTFTEEALKIVFSIISLNTLMNYYNSLSEAYITVCYRTQETFNALYSIWCESNRIYRYNESLGGITWSYNPTEKLLSSTLDLSIPLKRIPWLSATVYYGDTQLDDCSIWVGELHYRMYQERSSLTVDVILQAWAQVASHLVRYDDLTAYKFVVIDEMGEDRVYKIGDVVAK